MELKEIKVLTNCGTYFLLQIFYSFSFFCKISKSILKNAMQEVHSRMASFHYITILRSPSW